MLSRNYKSIAFATIAAVTLAGCSGGKEEGSQQNFQSPQGRNFVQQPRNNLITPPAPRNPTSGNSLGSPTNQELLDAINAKGDASVAAANAAKASADAAKAEATAAKDKAAAAENAAKAAESQAQKAKSKANAGFITGIVGAVLAAGGVGLGIWNLNRTKNQGEETRKNDNNNAQTLAGGVEALGTEIKNVGGGVGTLGAVVGAGLYDKDGKPVLVDDKGNSVPKDIRNVQSQQGAVLTDINSTGQQTQRTVASTARVVAQDVAPDAEAARVAAERGANAAEEGRDTVKRMEPEVTKALQMADEDRKKLIQAQQDLVAAQEKFNSALEAEKNQAKSGLEAATKAFNDAIAKIEALNSAQAPSSAPQILATYVKKDGSILRLDEFNNQVKLSEIKIDVQNNSVTISQITDAEELRTELPSNDQSAKAFIKAMEEKKLIKSEPQSDVKAPAPAAVAPSPSAQDLASILQTEDWKLVSLDQTSGVAILEQVLGDNEVGPRQQIEVPTNNLRVSVR